MTLIRPLLIAAALTLAGASSLTPAAPGFSAATAATRSCFYSHQVSAYRTADTRTIYARVGGGQIFRLDLAAECRSAVHGGAVLILEPVNGSICDPMDLDITVDENGALERCQVSQITRLTRDEAAALPLSSRP